MAKTSPGLPPVGVALPEWPSQSRLRLVAHRQRCRPRLCGGGSSLLTTASGTPPNCELRGRGLQLPLNDDSGRLRRKDDAMVYITTITLSERGLSGRECPAQLSKIHRAAEPGLEMA